MQVSNMFIMSLATADLIVGLIVIPLSATAFIFGPGIYSTLLLHIFSPDKQHYPILSRHLYYVYTAILFRPVAMLQYSVQLNIDIISIQSKYCILHKYTYCIILPSVPFSSYIWSRYIHIMYHSPSVSLPTNLNQVYTHTV